MVLFIIQVHLAGHGIQKTVQISRRQRCVFMCMWNSVIVNFATVHRLEEVVATSLRTSEGLTHEVRLHC